MILRDEVVYARSFLHDRLSVDDAEIELQSSVVDRSGVGFDSGPEKKGDDENQGPAPMKRRPEILSRPLRSAKQKRQRSIKQPRTRPILTERGHVRSISRRLSPEIFENLFPSLGQNFLCCCDAGGIRFESTNHRFIAEPGPQRRQQYRNYR